MNEIKYKILTFIDSSDTPVYEFNVYQHLASQNIDINEADKHFQDLYVQKLINTRDLREGLYYVTPVGRNYIDDYEYRAKHDALYIQELENAKATAKHSKIVSIISAVIALSAVVADIVISILSN